MSLVVYLDLDRTLYNTDRGGKLIWAEIGQAYRYIDTSHEHAIQKRYYVYQSDGNAYAYDFGAHVDALGLRREEVYAMLRSSVIADGRLEYAGVGELVSWISERGEAKVLTYGVDDYQRLKASLCPSLGDIEVITTLGDKGDYLADKGDVWLIDDKRIGGRLPENITFIQINHDDSRSDDHVNRPTARSLYETLKLLQKYT